MKTDRRSLLRFLGFGAAASVGEAVPGLKNAWIYDNAAMPPMAAGYMALGGTSPAVERAAQMGFQVVNAADDIARIQRFADNRRDEILAQAAEIEAAREYDMTDWGGAL